MIATLDESLDDLRVQESACIREVVGPDHLRQRLGEMGLTRGSTIRKVRTAPFGDPIQISVRDYHLCLRRDECRCVRIDRLLPGDPATATSARLNSQAAEGAGTVAIDRPAAGLRQSKWLRRLGLGAFVFFAVKGLLWLLVPILIAVSVR
jgi:ferrous iron transport protein A